MSIDLTQRLNGKCIVIIGGGGIGNELALRYASEGASVILADLNKETAEKGAASLPSGTRGRIIAAQCDGSNEESVNATVALATQHFGGLDGLHANFAAFLDGASSEGAGELPLSMFDTMSAVNTRGFLLATRAALPALVARGGGSILYTSSGAAYQGEPVRPYYAMTKAAGHALMRHVAARYGADGVRANTIAPGLIMHEELRKHISTEFAEQAREHSAYKRRLGEPLDIAAMCALLMSDEGAYVTGQVISIDGGTTMRG
ncbi:TPA: SDR family NAD(P)-dependent oxidoreductase [Stenotrophomonas maltophilia]|uniref:SDR family NAD(P)-dependent oxidoreductase n=1 Tax=Stenotrophomonas sp. GD03654 TaxID=2975362 RepID=UPI0024490C1A|nr:SDR family NAD(P)-dependent oxidoreductase [Stenotrophomonas sp. GD03654]HDS1367004.1 SDR family oxidoreductase [Stenotrophomonas maltophilia]MDH2177939.1 SDR family oxidoreductase [Stenotrophomonas sp. GD03654]HDS1371808.1 SDR family oxidoreductase [Stenotrophomonas maltophilia]HDS1376404.1 SDR family oxidoreductase [Stenotrophomonas maltophilia]HDS1381258.1 SDR family oxidoreductase [Stenotrophomonas maltophilia]